MAYKYQAYTSQKKIVEGTIEVASEKQAESALYDAGYQYILNLTEVSPGVSLETLVPTLFGVKGQEVIDFSNQLATLVESGISLITALQLLGGQTAKKPLKRIIDSLIAEIQGGNSLSQALGQYPRVFSNTYLQMIKASEQAGKLETGLQQAAGYLERQAIANQKIRQAMMYPAFVLLMAVGVSVLMITVALPPLIRLFESLGADLPWMTELLINVANFFINRGIYLLGGLIVLVILIVALLRMPSIQLARDQLMKKYR